MSDSAAPPPRTDTAADADLGDQVDRFTAWWESRTPAEQAQYRERLGVSEDADVAEMARAALGRLSSGKMRI